MSKRVYGTLVGVLTVVTIGVAGFGCKRVPEGETDTSQAESRLGKQTEHERRKANLSLQFADDFSQEYGPPDHFDLKRWTLLEKGQARTEGGYCLLEILPGSFGSPAPYGISNNTSNSGWIWNPGGYLDVDFGGPQGISSFRAYSVYASGKRGATFVVEHSDDGTNFSSTDGGSFSFITTSGVGVDDAGNPEMAGNGYAGWYQFDFNSDKTPHQHWRIRNGGVLVGHAPRLAELELFAIPNPDALDYDATTQAAGTNFPAHFAFGSSPDPPPSPGDIFFGGLATNERYLNPGLTGTNGVEITLADFTYEGDYPEKPEKPGGLMLIHCWSLTIGNWQGLVGGQPDKEKDRGVQLHFDLLPPDGLFLYLVRGLVPEDFDKYPRDGFGGPETKGMSERELRVLHEEAINTGRPFVTVPCLSLATRVYRTEQEINEILGRSRRYGLYLTDDANTVYWTLDGEVMDSIDITGYFSSNPESVREGAFLTVMGVGGFQRNTWRMDDLEIYTSP